MFLLSLFLYASEPASPDGVLPLSRAPSISIPRITTYDAFLQKQPSGVEAVAVVSSGDNSQTKAKEMFDLLGRASSATSGWTDWAAEQANRVVKEVGIILASLNDAYKVQASDGNIYILVVQSADSAVKLTVATRDAFMKLLLDTYTGRKTHFSSIPPALAPVDSREPSPAPVPPTSSGDAASPVLSRSSSVLKLSQSQSFKGLPLLGGIEKYIILPQTALVTGLAAVKTQVDLDAITISALERPSLNVEIQAANARIVLVTSLAAVKTQGAFDAIKIPASEQAVLGAEIQAAQNRPALCAQLEAVRTKEDFAAITIPPSEQAVLSAEIQNAESRIKSAQKEKRKGCCCHQ